MTRAEIVALFARRDLAWQRHDPEALAADHTDDGIGESPLQGRLEGRNRIREVYQTWFSAFPDMSFTSDDLLIDGHRVVQFFSVKGTQAGLFGGVPSTGRRMHITGAWLYSLDDSGHIVSDRRLYDATSMLVQIGALRTKPAGD